MTSCVCVCVRVCVCVCVLHKGLDKNLDDKPARLLRKTHTLTERERERERLCSVLLSENDYKTECLLVGLYWLHLVDDDINCVYTPLALTSSCVPSVYLTPISPSSGSAS